MQVFIMRHGDAALDAASDSVRPLTLCGCDESRQMATWLEGQKVDIERVLVSPFLRAEQTLGVVGECMPCRPTLMFSQNLRRAAMLAL
jgi:phosphohistidine phosphatase